MKSKLKLKFNKLHIRVSVTFLLTNSCLFYTITIGPLKIFVSKCRGAKFENELARRFKLVVDRKSEHGPL